MSDEFVIWLTLNRKSQARSSQQRCKFTSLSDRDLKKSSISARLSLNLQQQGWRMIANFRSMSIIKTKKIESKRVDFFVEDVMVEVKAQSEILPVHFVQALSYLKASGHDIGLLLNFGAPKLEIRRLINTRG